MKLHFKKIGEGQPILILHGLFGSSDNWQTHAKKLAENYCVYLVDQRNHGHSPHSADFSYELMAEDLLELIADEGLRDVILIGHSMGGKTIMRFAQDHDFLIDKMIVVDMGIKGYAPHHDIIFQGLYNVKVPNVASRKEAEERLLEFVTEPSTAQFLMKNLYWKTQTELAWRFNLDVLFDKINIIIQGLPNKEINVNTLFLVGGKSGYVPKEDFPSILEMVPQAQFVVIEEAGHWVHAETPAEFMTAVQEFLATS